MSLVGHVDGKLHIRRQVDDYALRGDEFETMGFLTFIVETYERRIMAEEINLQNEDQDEIERSNKRASNYLSGHPKCGTHSRTLRSENHNFLPNIVGPWLPRRDGEEADKCFYYASMLSLLKPWRNLHRLKGENESWEDAFTSFLKGATQRDKDIVSGCQYYYESKHTMTMKDLEDARLDDDMNVDIEHAEGCDEEMEESDPSQTAPVSSMLNECSDVVQ